ncbi:MAG: anti-sigma factor antagonist [Chloroflexi bacterium]|nr:MAG: anti-sigma factor antagonist [Chloroflexota bacterium]RLC86201.1 MAG: anti-sigma factor antagonist [Chloroflexota bacterium]
MQVTTKRLKRCELVKATGRIDSNTAPQLTKALDAINKADCFRIVFDMSEVEFISSAGLRVLINAQKTCKRWNRGELVLASVPQRVHEALDLAGFLPLFKFYDDATEAVGSF